MYRMSCLTTVVTLAALGRPAAVAAQPPAATRGASVAASPATDTLVDVGGYRFHFRVVPGRGVPILFEHGGGDDATVWRDLLPRVAAVTGAPLIAYDRPGFGRSGLDTTRRGIVPAIRGLEAGLAALGYAGDVVLVAHSMGGFYATLYAARHPERVKAAVLLDASHACFFGDDQVRGADAELARHRAESPGLAELAAGFDSIVAVMRRTAFPPRVPVVDVVAERTLYDGTPDAARWTRCHAQFVAAAPAREGVTAYGSGHYVFRDSPELVIAVVAKAYAGAAGPARRADVLARGVAHAVDAINALQRSRHSEDDVNDWGYALLGRGERAAALAAFRLNVALHPGSANAHDSLGDGDEAVNDRDGAVRAYRRALALDPTFRHAVERLHALAPNGGR